MVKPREEFLRSILVEILAAGADVVGFRLLRRSMKHFPHLGRPPIEVWIKLVNHRSKLLDGLQTYGVCIRQEDPEAVNDGSQPHKTDKIV